MKTLASEYVFKKKSGHKFATLTAYDYPLARLMDEVGLDFILVGDSMGMVVLGHPDTTFVTLEMMRHHVAAAARGVKQTLLIADLPIHSADTSEQAVKSARLLLEAGAKGVKLEGGEEVAPQVAALVADGIPVLGHIGMLPQRVNEEGGYRIKGKTPQQAEQLKADARALEKAGVFGIVLELVSPPLALEISQQLEVPTIGIGSGPDCDGQILVTYDLLGLSPWFKPRFVVPKRDLATEIQSAAKEYIAEIRG